MDFEFDPENFVISIISEHNNFMKIANWMKYLRDNFQKASDGRIGMS